MPSSILERTVVVVASFIMLGGILVVFGLSNSFAGRTVTSTTSNQSSLNLAANGPDPTHPKVGDIFPYDCGAPASKTDLSCTKLPSGYVILDRQPNAPQPARPVNMTDSAWQLIQKTFGNGVCDPNETWWTSPLDCAAQGNQINDPYTGRVGFVTSVCQQNPGPPA